ncbi:hypothetical protein D3C81_1565210 [compost metagenome]
MILYMPLTQMLSVSRHKYRFRKTPDMEAPNWKKEWIRSDTFASCPNLRSGGTAARLAPNPLIRPCKPALKLIRSYIMLL